MCHCQLSGPMLPRLAAMPPCAATVWTAGREHLGHAGRAQPLLGHAQRRAQAGTAGPHHDHVIVMRLIRIGSHHQVLQSAMRASANRPVAAITQDSEITNDDQHLARRAPGVILDHRRRAHREVAHADHQHQRGQDRREGAREGLQHHVARLAQGLAEDVQPDRHQESQPHGRNRHRPVMLGPGMGGPRPSARLRAVR